MNEEKVLSDMRAAQSVLKKYYRDLNGDEDIITAISKVGFMEFLEFSTVAYYKKIRAIILMAKQTNAPISEEILKAFDEIEPLFKKYHDYYTLISNADIPEMEGENE
jgi:hypothetical protein